MNYAQVTLKDLLAFAAIRRRAPDPTRFYSIPASYLGDALDTKVGEQYLRFRRLEEYGWIEVSPNRKQNEARALRVTERGLREVERWREALFG